MTIHEETAASMMAKATPPIAVIAANQMPLLSLPDIVNYCTLLYLALMISHKAWRMYREWRTGKAVKDDE